MHNSKAPLIQVNFDPSQVLKQAEANLHQTFRQAIDAEIRHFCNENKHHTPSGLKVMTGAGLLLIREWLEKKFDDPELQNRMDTYFNANFDRIMEAAMQTALEHKAKAFVFSKAATKA